MSGRADLARAARDLARRALEEADPRGDRADEDVQGTAHLPQLVAAPAHELKGAYIDALETEVALGELEHDPVGQVHRPGDAAPDQQENREAQGQAHGADRQEDPEQRAERIEQDI